MRHIFQVYFSSNYIHKNVILLMEELDIRIEEMRGPWNEGKGNHLILSGEQKLDQLRFAARLKEWYQVTINSSDVHVKVYNYTYDHSFECYYQKKGEELI